MNVSPETVDNFMEKTGEQNWSHSSHNLWIGIGSYFPFMLVPFPFSLIFTLLDFIIFVLVLPLEIMYYIFVVIFWIWGMILPLIFGKQPDRYIIKGTGSQAVRIKLPSGRIRPTYRPLQ